MANFEPTTLYISGIHPTTEERDLSELFSTVSGLVAVRMADYSTGLDSKQAFADYSTDRAAVRAIEQFDYSLFKGLPLRVMRASREKSKYVCVKGIPSDYSRDDVTLILNFSGKVADFDLFPSVNNEQMCYAEFCEEEDAIKCCEILDGFVTDGKKLLCNLYFPFSGNENVDLKVTGFKKCNEKMLWKLFSKFGAVKTRIVVEQDKPVYGLVSFDTRALAEKAIDKMDGYLENDSVLTVTRLLTPKPEKKTTELDKGTTLVVKNFDSTIPESTFINLFESFGEIVKYKIEKTPKSNRGFAFVTFRDFGSAEQAVEALNNTDLLGENERAKKLNVTFLKLC